MRIACLIFPMIAVLLFMTSVSLTPVQAQAGSSRSTKRFTAKTERVSM